MIRGRVDSSSMEMFTRNRLRVMVEQDGPGEGGYSRTLVYAEQTKSDYRPPDGPGLAETPPVQYPGWYDPARRPGDGGIPEGATPFVLDCQRDVAYAVYLALRDEFEGADTTPVASDRAYADAREDIDRLHGLVDRVTDALIDRPHVVAVRPGYIDGETHDGR
jgi:hypothetical protein